VLNNSKIIVKQFKAYVLNPTKYFEGFIDNPSYEKHLGIIVLIAIARSLISNQINKQSLNQFAPLLLSGPSGTQGDNIVINVLGFLNSPLLITIGTIALVSAGFFISSAICYFIIGKLFNGGKSFEHMMSIMVVSGYPPAAYSLFSSFFPKDMDMDLFQTLLSVVNVFTFWNIALMLVGISVVFNISREKSMVVNIIIILTVLAINFVNCSSVSW